ncbi:MAG: BMP family ABC transporter substrate-binding protein [Acidimicrobiia bacterium]|nr:BMP family ABC transporter substrate-binding protein [Acidimicrobiia bacterium]
MAQSAPLDLGIPGLEDAMLLGRGGFAVVYRAYQPAFRRTVAVKVVSVTEVDELTRERFRRECQAMGLLSEHPSIVTVLEAGFLDDGRPFLVMAYMPEGSLQDRLRQGPLGWQEATRIAVKLAGALGTAHQAGVLHRDVKPANVLVSQYGEPQLADFGIARVAGGQETSSGVITASLSYAPPEIVDGQRPSVASDVYSLGATVHALMTGAAPFWKDREDSIAALLNRVMNHPPRDLREFGVPSNVAEVLELTMAKDPQDRPASAAQFGRLLRLAEDENGLRPTQMTVYKPADEPHPPTPPVEAPPTEVAPSIEDSEDFTDSPTDIVDTDEMLTAAATATAAATSINETPSVDGPPTGTVEQDAAETEVIDEQQTAEVVAPVADGLVAAPDVEASEPVVEPEMAPTATVAAASAAAPPDATTDLPAGPEAGQEPEAPGRRRGLWLGVAAVVALLAVVGGFFLTRGGDAGPIDTTIRSTSDGSSDFEPPPWWTADPVLGSAVLVDHESHVDRNFEQLAVGSGPVTGEQRWVAPTPPAWSPEFYHGWMLVGLSEGEQDPYTEQQIEEKRFFREPASAEGDYAAVVRFTPTQLDGYLLFNLEHNSADGSEHRMFSIDLGTNSSGFAFTTQDGDQSGDDPFQRPIELEVDKSYDLALVATTTGAFRALVWPSGEMAAGVDEVAGIETEAGHEFVTDNWIASIGVGPGSAISIDEFWGFRLPTPGGDAAVPDDEAEPGPTITFDFPQWWLADPDWSRAELVDHETHDSYNWVVGDTAASVWHSPPPPPTWRGTFGGGLMTIATERGESDNIGIPIESKRFWRAPTTSTNEYAAVFRLIVNELGDGFQIFIESGAFDAGFFRNVVLVVDGEGQVFAHYSQGDDDSFLIQDLDNPMKLLPGTSYDVALFAEGGGVFNLRLWPTGQSPQELEDVPGIRLELGDEFVVTGGWDPGMDVVAGASVSIDEYWGFELPGAGDEAPLASADVGLVFDIGGRGDQSFNDAAAAGLDQATAELGIRPSEASANQDGSNREELLALQADESDLVFGVGFLFAEPMLSVAEAYPDVSFAIVDDSSIDLPNVANLVFAEEEGSYLVGVAAALNSPNLRVGFIGGVNMELIQRFEAGFTAGVTAVNPLVTVDVQYLTEPPDFAGFNDPAAARVVAEAMYQRGADVIYHAAGGSGAGLFQAAKDYSEANNTKVWAIGVDSDQYLTADEGVRPYILTSMMKRVDTAVYTTVQDFVSGRFTSGTTVLDLSVDGVGYATSGGFVNAIIDQLEDYKTQIIYGSIQVPTVP